MAPRTSWKGFIRLSLVSVPVKAYTASVTSGDIRLNQLHQECNSRIKYKKTCPTHGDVAADEIVSGYEFTKGQYVVVDTDEIQKLRVQSDRSVQVHGFIKPDAIDPIYYAGKTYYLTPDGPVGQKPYELLRQGMIENEVHALAQIIIAGRENLVVLRPSDDMLTMTVLMWHAKVKQPTTFSDELVTAEITKEELALTNTLITASKLDEFDFSEYKDRYTEQLTTLIQSKVEGKEIVAVAEVEEPQIINLMEALKASVAKAQGGAETEEAPPAKTAKKKMASSTKKAAARKKKSG